MLLQAVGGHAVESHLEEFPLPDVGDGVVPEGAQGVVDGLPLGIEDGANREIEALESMGINPLSYIVFPRILGGVISVVCLAFYFISY